MARKPAKKKPPPRSKELPADVGRGGRALQLTDLDEPGTKALTRNMEHTGRNIKAIAKDQVKRLATSQDKKADDRIAALNTVLPTLHNVDMSIEGAAERRANLYLGALSRQDHDRARGRDQGTGSAWYFGHRRDLRSVAEETGIPERRVITGSAVMSPANSPDNEKAAVAELARAHSKDGPGIKITSAVEEHFGAPEGYRRGQTAPASAFTPEQLVSMTAEDFRDKAGGQSATDLDLKQMARGGVRKQMVEAVNLLRGAGDPETHIDPVKRPKVGSYEQSIVNAEPDSNIEREYNLRVAHIDDVLRGRELRGQGLLDLYGERDSKGILDPKGGTAEDSWQNAFTHGQSLEALQIEASDSNKEGTVPAKTIGSDKRFLDINKTNVFRGKRTTAHPNAEVGPAALLHAYNNAATIRAAEMVGQATGFTDEHGESLVPSVLVQEVGWTEGRRRAGKDPSYKGDPGQWDATNSYSPQFHASPQATPREAPRPREEATAHTNLDLSAHTRKPEDRGKPLSYREQRLF